MPLKTQKSGWKELRESVCVSPAEMSCGMCVAWSSNSTAFKTQRSFSLSRCRSDYKQLWTFFSNYIWRENGRAAFHIKHTHRLTRGLAIQKISFACKVYLLLITIALSFSLFLQCVCVCVQQEIVLLSWARSYFYSYPTHSI